MRARRRGSTLRGPRASAITPTPHPLTGFSRYLSGRNQVLLTLAAQIVADLDACGPDEAAARSEARARASDRMWLWTLGAYEVVRTMCQAVRCFSPLFHGELSDLKAELERVRVPNTKMERIKYDRKDRSVPVPSDRAPEIWVDAHKDILVGDPADPMSARRLLATYERVLASLAVEDVRMKHEDAYERD